MMFPFSSLESFRQAEWIGRESEWFRIFNVLHWTLARLDFEPATLLLQPDSPQFAENLRACLDNGRIITLEAEDADAPPDELIARLEDQAPASHDLLLATAVFGTGADLRDETRLLRACHRVLKPGGYLLATFPLQDDFGNALTARNFGLLDAAANAGFEQEVILGCDGIARHLRPEFWDKLRTQSRPAFDTVLHACSQVSDEPAALWMSRTAFYAGIKR